MKAKWLIEPDVFEDNTDKLIEQLKLQKIEYKIVPYVPFDNDRLRKC